MSQDFFDLHDLTQGVARELGPGINTRIFAGDQAMLSVVRMAPHASGKIHNHDEEQWGVCLEGDAVRIQEGKEFPVKAGQFWRTPGGVMHGIRAGANGALVLDIFAPPRKAYTKAGTGFGTG
jgi:quercetin dioxygenase-like cupin family protein